MPTNPFLRKVRSRYRSFKRVAPRLSSAGDRVLPDFIIPGAQKSGTTSLFAYLAQHPDVMVPLKKELHYFDSWAFLPDRYYQAQFPRRSEMADGKITGEASAAYLVHPRIPRKVAKTVPDAKIIVTLRNPIDRAWSHYKHGQRRSPFLEPLSFEEALDAEEERMRKYRRSIWHFWEPDDAVRPRYAYQSRGRYAEQLRRWYDAFPRQNILVLQAEKLFAEPDQVVARCLVHLGLAPYDGFDFKARNVGGYRSSMDEETRARLGAYFAPHNDALYELIGERFDWD